jgi:hypothetical protein
LTAVHRGAAVLLGSMTAAPQSPVGEVDGSSNSWNVMTITASHSSQRKKPDSVSTVAGARSQASQILHRVNIG